MTELVQSFGLEGTKYLMIANGGVLIAAISGIGEAWHHEELRWVFAILVSDFSVGLWMASFAWFLFGIANAISEGRSNDLRVRRMAAPSTWLGSLFAVLSFSSVIMSIGFIIGHFGGPIWRGVWVLLSTS